MNNVKKLNCWGQYKVVLVSSFLKSKTMKNPTYKGRCKRIDTVERELFTIK